MKMAEKTVDISSPENQTDTAVDSSSALPPPPQEVSDLCKETFDKMSDYLMGELTMTVEDYSLLEQMNKVTMNKYFEMKQMTANISTAMQELNDKYQHLQPYLDQIDHIEDSVASLEQAAYKLDAYSKRLEAKFKALEKR